MKIARVALGFYLGAFASFALASVPRSNHLTHFDLVQCHPAGCFRARADFAFVSQNGETFSAQNVALEIDPKDKGKKDRHRCAFFCYDLKTQDLTCDNRDVTKTATLTIDRDFKIHFY